MLKSGYWINPLLDHQIVTNLTSGKKILISNFDAFKFPTSDVVQFRALVTPCMPKCEPVDCTYRDYYGGDKTRFELLS